MTKASGIERGERHLNGPQTSGRDYRNLSQPRFDLVTEEDVPVSMRDGVKLLADVHRPSEPGRYPALIAASPYPRQIQNSGAPMGFVEAGASDFFVPRGYVHVASAKSFRRLRDGTPLARRSPLTAVKSRSRRWAFDAKRSKLHLHRASRSRTGREGTRCDAGCVRHLRSPLPWACAALTAGAFSEYRRQGGGRSLPMPDFYIGSHAAVANLSVLTRDPAGYRSYFPRLRLIGP